MNPSPNVHLSRRHRARPLRRRLAALVPALAVGLAVAVLVPGIGAQDAGAQTLIPAPPVSVSGDGLTATDGTRTLGASQTQGLSPSGARVTVTGSGYDTNKGIYVAFCLIPPTNQLPTPCGGGVDMSGATGSSQWIAHPENAPAYGDGLFTPYGTGGTFSLSIEVSPKINNSIDCRRVRCAIVTRNDHTRTSDRGQDIFLPITFAADPGPSGQPNQPGQWGQPEQTTTTTAPEVLPAPAVTLSADGRVATAGAMTLEVSQATDLDAMGMPVTVTGSGFDEAKGIGVGFCVVGDAGQVPGPCADGSENASSALAWISSDPPEGGEAAVPYRPGGSFSLTIATTPTISGADCAEVTCAIVTSNDTTRPFDRSQDIVIPVSFAEPVAATTSTTATNDLAAGTTDESSSGPIWPYVLAGVLIVAAGGGVAYLIVRRRAVGTP